MRKQKSPPKEIAGDDPEFEATQMRNLLARGAEEIRHLRQRLAIAEAKVSTMELFSAALIAHVPTNPMGYQEDITYQMEGFSKVLKK